MIPAMTGNPPKGKLVTFDYMNFMLFISEHQLRSIDTLTFYVKETLLVIIKVKPFFVPHTS